MHGRSRTVFALAGTANDAKGFFADVTIWLYEIDLDNGEGCSLPRQQTYCGTHWLNDSNSMFALSRAPTGFLPCLKVRHMRLISSLKAYPNGIAGTATVEPTDRLK